MVMNLWKFITTKLAIRQKRQQETEQIHKDQKQQIQQLEQKIQQLRQQISQTTSSKKRQYLRKQINQLRNQLQQPPPEIQICNTTKAWISAGIITLISLILWIAGAKTLAVILFSLLLIWIGATLKEIKEPQRAFLFQMGKLKGQLNPGWHLGFPFVWSIEEISMETQEYYLEREEMYTKEQTAISLELGIYFRVVNLLKAVYIKPEVAKERIKRVVLSKLKWKIGELEFEKILGKKGDMEDEVKMMVNDDLRNDGYEVIGIEIEDVMENIKSEAAKKRVIGGAEAEVDRKKAEAIAEPLRNNYPAAIAMATGSIGDKIVGKIIEMSKKESKGGKAK
jgi:uncharacterized membrane protein YqiK